MSADTAVPELPLRELWKLELAARGRTPHAPVVREGRVAARCNNDVVAADAATGKRLWSTRVDPEPLTGELFIDCGGFLVTDQRRQADRTTTLVALDWDGRQVWTRELAVLASRGALAWDARRLVVAGVEPETGQPVLLELAPRTGAVLAKSPLPWGADALTLLGEQGMLVASRHASGSAPGLYRLARAGGDATPVSPRPVERVLLTERSVLTLGAPTEEEGAPPPAVEARDADTLAPRWSASAAEAALGAEGGEVAHVEAVDGQRTLVLRDEVTGTVRWRAPATQSMAVHVSLAEGLVVVKDLDGLGVYRRRDGVLLGYEEDSFSRATPDANRLYVGHRNTLRCLSTTV